MGIKPFISLELEQPPVESVLCRTSLHCRVGVVPCLREHKLSFVVVRISSLLVVDGISRCQLIHSRTCDVTLHARRLSGTPLLSGRHQGLGRGLFVDCFSGTSLSVLLGHHIIFPAAVLVLDFHRTLHARRSFVLWIDLPPPIDGFLDPDVFQHDVQAMGQGL